MKMQFKNTKLYHVTPTKMAKIKNLTIPIVIKDMEQQELWYTSIWTVIWNDHFGKQFGIIYCQEK